MLEIFAQYILLVVIILMLVMLAQKIRIAYPIVLVISGLAWSLYSGEPLLDLEPELIFILFLPPLLYEAAWKTSWKEFWRWRRVISSFAFLIVLVTSFVIALVSSYLLPGFTLALGFLLGGIISPPDAISATTIMRNVRAPKRIVAIAEGESLLNDASSLIVFRFALIAVDTGRFVFHEAALSFVLVVVMGSLIGIVVGLIYFAMHKWLPTTSTMDIILSLTAPYVMYIAAEWFHFSGVLSVVSGGLFLSEKSHLFLNPRSRLWGSNVWTTFGFLLIGIVFILIGLELPVIIEQLGAVNLVQAIYYGLLISGVLMVLRVLCALGASVFTVFISRYITTADSRPGWRGPLVLGWSGMRGVVSLAAALSIPLTLSDGTAFPQRNLIIFITFTVILVTLIVQGLTLPWLIRWLRLEDPDAKTTPLEQDKLIRKHLGERSLTYLEKEYPALLENNKGLQKLKDNYEIAQYVTDPISETDHQDYRRIYLHLLAQQRRWLKEWNKTLDIDEDVIRRHQDMLDLEEEKLLLKFNEVSE